jgi:hypothetical protein
LTATATSITEAAGKEHQFVVQKSLEFDVELRVVNGERGFQPLLDQQETTMSRGILRPSHRAQQNTQRGDDQRQNTVSTPDQMTFAVRWP